MKTADDTREAEKVIETAERFHDGVHAFCDAGSVRDVYCYGEDPRVWKIFRQGKNLGLRSS